MSTPNLGGGGTTPPITPLTWLCTFNVQVDLPNTLSITQAEQAVAFAIASYFNANSAGGNCSVQLIATQGNASVANPTQAVALPVASNAVNKAGGTGV